MLLIKMVSYHLFAINKEGGNTSETAFWNLANLSDIWICSFMVLCYSFTSPKLSCDIFPQKEYGRHFIKSSVDFPGVLAV